NCIAWAAGEHDRWWWPDPQMDYYWPDGVPREQTVEAFIEAYRTIGYEVCLDGVREAGFQKIVIYAKNNGEPTHAARQLPDGTWTSKLGQNVDVEHSTPESILQFQDCYRYGRPLHYMRRPIPNP